MGEEGLGFLYSQPALVPIIITIEELLNVLWALFTPIFASPLHSSLIVVENYTQQYIHQEKHAEDDEYYKVYGVPSACIVSKKHNIREVRRGD